MTNKDPVQFGSNVPDPDRAVDALPVIELPPGRYRLSGYAPETGLLLTSFIDVGAHNQPGCYGAGDRPIAGAMPDLFRIEDSAGQIVWGRA